eukprot:1767613-Amphidinium_carterae.3
MTTTHVAACLSSMLSVLFPLQKHEVVMLEANAPHIASMTFMAEKLLTRDHINRTKVDRVHLRQNGQVECIAPPLIFAGAAHHKLTFAHLQLGRPMGQ